MKAKKEQVGQLPPHQADKTCFRIDFKVMELLRCHTVGSFLKTKSKSIHF